MRLIAGLLLLSLTAAAHAAEPLPPTLAAYAGKVVYLDFWASWCGPCGEAFPWLNEMQAKYGQDLTVVGVGVDVDARAAEAFLKRHPARFDIVKDPEGALPERFHIDGMPSAVILDGRGRVLHQHSGFRPEETQDYEAAIKAALANKEARQ